MSKLTERQLEMVRALNLVSREDEFCSGDMAKLYGYPHKDASKVLQQDVILGHFITYSTPPYRAAKTRYRLAPQFDSVVARWEMAEARAAFLDRREPLLIGAGGQ